MRNIPLRLAVLMLATASLHAGRPAAAATIHIRPDGTGDAPTIVAGLNMLMRLGGEGHEMILEAGRFDERVLLSWGGEVEPPGMTIRGAAGAESTRVREFVLEGPGTNTPGVFIEGVTIESRVDANTASGRVQWNDCVFEAGYAAYGFSCAPTNLFDCTFRGPVRLDGAGDAWTPYSGLRFDSAPLYVRPDVCYIRFVDCHFAGPADTLVSMHSGDDIGVDFKRCSFQDADYAIAPVRSMSEEQIVIDSTRFTRIARDGLSYTLLVADFARPAARNFFKVSDSEFDSCGTAIRLTTNLNPAVFMNRVAISNSTGDAIVLRPATMALDSVSVRNSGGDGLAIDVDGYLGVNEFLDVTNSRFVGNTGSGITVVDTATAIRIGLRFLDNRLESNGGDGARVTAGRSTWLRNVFAVNRGHGIQYASLRVDTTTFDHPDTIANNTSVLNDRHGLWLYELGEGPWHDVHVFNNLLAGNRGIGLALPHDPTPAAHGNGMWANIDADYKGYAWPALNLIADPGLCDVYAGDYRLQQSSPYGPTGPYGLIGAFGIGCDDAGLGGGRRSGRYADAGERLRIISTGRNPVTGPLAITFSLASDAPASLALFDIGGRRVAEQHIDMAARGTRTLELSHARRLAAGVYFVRLEQGGETRHRQVVVVP